MPKSVTKNNQDMSSKKVTTKQRGDAAEMQALHHLQDQGLQLVQRNYRTPGRGGGEIDLIMQDSAGTLVFVEVRQRAQADHGGALASVTWAKQRRIVFAARCFLSRFSNWPPCRFDVVAVQGSDLTWFCGAFEAG